MHSQRQVDQWAAHETGVLGIKLISTTEGQPRRHLMSHGRDGKICTWEIGKNIPVHTVLLDDQSIKAEVVRGLSNPSLLATDPMGNIYAASFVGKESSVTNKFQLPSRNVLRKFVMRRPAPPERPTFDAEKNPTSSDNLQLNTASIRSTNDVEPEAKSLSSNNALSDLTESRNALTSVESSLKRAYETVNELEETVARLKQLIAIQEARIQQAELLERKNK